MIPAQAAGLSAKATVAMADAIQNLRRPRTVERHVDDGCEPDRVGSTCSDGAAGALDAPIPMDSTSTTKTTTPIDHHHAMTSGANATSLGRVGVTSGADAEVVNRPSSSTLRREVAPSSTPTPPLPPPRSEEPGFFAAARWGGLFNRFTTTATTSSSTTPVSGGGGGDNRSAIHPRLVASEPHRPRAPHRRHGGRPSASQTPNASDDCSTPPVDAPSDVTPNEMQETLERALRHTREDGGGNVDHRGVDDDDGVDVRDEPSGEHGGNSTDPPPPLVSSESHPRIPVDDRDTVVEAKRPDGWGQRLRAMSRGGGEDSGLLAALRIKRVSRERVRREAPMLVSNMGEGKAPSKGSTIDRREYQSLRQSQLEVTRNRRREWCESTHARTMATLNPELFDTLQAQDLDPRVDRAIRKDLLRTFPEESMFASASGHGVDALYRTLKAYAAFQPKVGYCQGLNFVVGCLLLGGLTDDEAFWALLYLSKERGLHRIFKPGMPGLTKCIDIFGQLLHDVMPRLAAHLEKNGVPASMFSSKWFISLYSYSLPVTLVMHIWDMFMESGWAVMWAVGLAILRLYESELMKRGMEHILFELDKIKSTVVSRQRELLSHIARYRHVLKTKLPRKPIAEALGLTEEDLMG